MPDDATIVLVTGANKGIGYAAARRLGAGGATVVLGARDAGRGASAARRLAAEGIVVDHVLLDVTDRQGVEAAAEQIGKEHGRLDVLVNNAGIMLERGEQPSEVTAELMRETFETNVFGVVTVTNAMLPLLRRSAAGRIVNLSSSLGSLALCSTPGTIYAQWPIMAYVSSKTAVNALTVKYANELRDTPIKVNSACPGYVATDLTGNNGARSPEEAAEIVVRLATLGADGPTAGFFDVDGPVAW
jgi:NAD(P)-dependent dehydrogenase (short-subunit alcohol dehydrogenase family)